MAVKTIVAKQLSPIVQVIAFLLRCPVLSFGAWFRRGLCGNAYWRTDSEDQEKQFLHAQMEAVRRKLQMGRGDHGRPRMPIPFYVGPSALGFLAG